MPHETPQSRRIPARGDPPDSRGPVEPPEAQWYYLLGSEQVGPVAESWLWHAIAAAALPAGIPVWSASLDDWTPADRLYDKGRALTPSASRPLDAAIPPLSGESRPPRPVVHATSEQRRPWVRFWARSFDYSTAFALPVVILLVGVGPRQVPSLWLPIIELGDAALVVVLAVMVAVSAFFLEVSLLSTWGSTPGKWLLNVRVRHASGRKLTYGEALRRTFRVWYHGQALGIPPFSIFAQIRAYERLKSQGFTSWDGAGCVLVGHRRIGWVRFAAYVLLCLVGSTNHEGAHQAMAQNTAMALLDRGDYEGSARAWGALIRLDPANAVAWWYLAEVQRMRGLVEEAILALEQGSIKAPEDPDFPRRLVPLLLQVGRYPESLEQAQELVRLEPEAGEGYSALGDAYLWNGRPREAVEQYREAVERLPRDATVKADLAFALLLADEPPASWEQYQAYVEAVDQPVVYYTFYATLALRRISDPQRAHDLLRGLESEKVWVQSLAGYLTDESTSEDLLAEANEPDQLSEAYFFIGYRSLIDGDDRHAAECFRRSIAAEAYPFYEHAGSLIELAKLERERP